MLLVFLPCMAVQVYAYGRNQLPTTLEAVAAKAPAPDPKANPDAFLDEFAKRYVGYSLKEIETGYDHGLLEKRGTPELIKLQTAIDDAFKSDYENHRINGKFDVLTKMKLFLSTSQYPRATKVEKMRELWAKVDSKVKQELRIEFPAFELFK